MTAVNGSGKSSAETSQQFNSWAVEMHEQDEIEERDQ